jgi:hypothetical protein
MNYTIIGYHIKHTFFVTNSILFINLICIESDYSYSNIVPLITINTYVHLYSEKQVASAEILGKALEIDGAGVTSRIGGK